MSKPAEAAAVTLPQTIDPNALPEIYGMRINGTCMEPAYPDRSRIKVSTVEAYTRGDVVVVWFRPEVVPPGQKTVLLKRLVMMPPPWVKSFPYQDHPKSDVQAVMAIARDDTPGKMMMVRCADVLAIHKCLGSLLPDQPAAKTRRPKPRLVRP